jgi:hypothetical protein
MKTNQCLISLGLSLVLAGAIGCSGRVSDDATDTNSSAFELALNEVELIPTDDARIQGGAPDANYRSGQLWINTEAAHYSLLKFDLTALPAGATIESARLVLRYTGNYTGERTVELGRVDSAWSEETVTWNSDLAITWGGPSAPVDGAVPSDVEWDVTGLVERWQEGTAANEGFAMRGQGNGPGKLFHSKETSSEFPPRLVIEYTAPVRVGPVEDCGDAPDSTNHHGVGNVAYPGVPGQFPTVWNMAGVSGPRHANPQLWGFLGTVITREVDADLLPDEDGPANILLDAAGVVSSANNDNDNGDESWLNQNRLFVDCQRETLRVRVARASQQVGQMYLNVWFDGNHDGDWGDSLPCIPPSGGAPVQSFEWALQNQVINMGAIPAGGYVDLNFDTERVLNTTLGAEHWVRFTLSESPAVVPGGGGFPDGRGKPVALAPNGFQYGETEDYLHRIPSGEPGDLVLEKRVLADEEALAFGGVATYQVRLRHVGGSTPVAASIRDLLPLPLSEMHVISPLEVVGTPSGAGPLQGDVAYEPNSNKHGVRWDGVLAPNSEITLEFDVHVHVDCLPFAVSKTVTNVAEATGDGQSVAAEAEFQADCPGETEPTPIEDPIDVDQLPIYYL